MSKRTFKKSALNFLAPLSMAFALLAVGAAVQAQTLQLNGAGIRYQASAPLYSAELYLNQKVATPAQAMGSPGIKQLRVVMLRDVKSAELGDLLASGMVSNASDDELSKLIPVLFSLGEILGEQKQLLAGDSFQITMLPDASTSINIQAKARLGPTGTCLRSPSCSACYCACGWANVRQMKA
jgi:hypothetical protein